MDRLPLGLENRIAFTHLPETFLSTLSWAVNIGPLSPGGLLSVLWITAARKESCLLSEFPKVPATQSVFLHVFYGEYLEKIAGYVS